MTETDASELTPGQLNELVRITNHDYPSWETAVAVGPNRCLTWTAICRAELSPAEEAVGLLSRFTRRSYAELIDKLYGQSVIRRAHRFL